VLLFANSLQILKVVEIGEWKVEEKNGPLFNIDELLLFGLSVNKIVFGSGQSSAK
jgi:hypothetical protein